MPGAGTDKTKRWVETPGPVVILVESQLGENIGAVARVMANFGLSRLRLVRPRQAWPNDKARMMAAGADRVLDGAALYDTLEGAIADCSFVLAATARAHDQAKPVVGPAEAVALMAPRVAAGENVAILFGRERNGLENDEVALADSIVTLPVNPAFASLNLAPAVGIVAYEWLKVSSGDTIPFAVPQKSAAAPKEQLLAFFASLERELERWSSSGRRTSARPCRSICATFSPACSRRSRTSRPCTASSCRSPKAKVRSAAACSTARRPNAARTARRARSRPGAEGARGPVRGLARLLRRNPTEAERMLWEALVTIAASPAAVQAPDAGWPAHLRLCFFPAAAGDRSGAGRRKRSRRKIPREKRDWLKAHDYTVLGIFDRDVESDMAAALARIENAIGQS